MSIPDISSILLVGTEHPVALPVIRAIGRAFPDTAIHTLSPETDTYQSPNYSKYVSSRNTLHSTEGEEFLNELISGIKKTGAEILLPVNEGCIREVSLYKKTLTDFVKLPPVPLPDVLDSVRNKDKLAETLISLGLDSPATCRLSSEDYHKFFYDYSPCLIKPVQGSSGYGIEKLKDHSALENIVSYVDRDSNILQELIPGEDIDCSFLAVDGQVKAYTIQRGLFNVGYNFSTAIYFQHYESVIEYVKTLVRQIGYSGIAHLDFRLDSRDGLVKLIDFNARFWFSMEGSKAAGIDFALLYCLEAMKHTYAEQDFNDCVFLMGKSTFKRFGRFVRKSNKKNLPIHTDFKSRLTDPVPEIVRRF